MYPYTCSLCLGGDMTTNGLCVSHPYDVTDVSHHKDETPFILVMSKLNLRVSALTLGLVAQAVLLGAAFPRL